MSADSRLDGAKEVIADSRYPQLSGFLSNLSRKDGSSYFCFDFPNGGAGTLSVRDYILPCHGEGDRDAFIINVSFNNRLLRAECHVSGSGNIVITRTGSAGGLDLLERLVPRCSPMPARPSPSEFCGTDSLDAPIAEEPTVTAGVTDEIRRVLGISA